MEVHQCRLTGEADSLQIRSVDRLTIDLSPCRKRVDGSECFEMLAVLVVVFAFLFSAHPLSPRSQGMFEHLDVGTEKNQEKRHFE